MTNISNLVQNHRLTENAGAFIVLICLFISLTFATEQPTGPLHTNHISMMVGLNPNAFVELGYARAFDSVFFQHSISTGLYFSTSLIRPCFEDWDASFRAEMDAFTWRTLAVETTPRTIVGYISTRNYNSNRIAIGDELLIGYRGKVLSIGALADFEHNILNYIKNSVFYRTTYYEDAKDGWYLGAAGRWQFGLRIAAAITRRALFDLDVRLPYSSSFDGYGGSPVHANFRIRYMY